MPIAWNDDPPGSAPRLRANLEHLSRELAEQALRRDEPRVQLAQAWHRAVFQGIRLPVPYYAGEFRDDDPRFPELVGYEVRVGPWSGVPARRVPQELARFEARLRAAVALLDGRVAPAAAPETAEVLRSALTLCAHAHGEWARIHPFANGNGRIARLWANWCALRYGLPAFVRLRPRPSGALYARAASDSMRGDHRATVSLFSSWLVETLST